MEEFKTSVTVAAHKKITFELTYEELLKRTHGKYELLIHAQPMQPVKDFKVFRLFWTSCCVMCPVKIDASNWLVCFILLTIRLMCIFMKKQASVTLVWKEDLAPKLWPMPSPKPLQTNRYSWFQCVFFSSFLQLTNLQPVFPLNCALAQVRTAHAIALCNILS